MWKITKAKHVYRTQITETSDCKEIDHNIRQREKIARKEYEFIILKLKKDVILKCY